MFENIIENQGFMIALSGISVVFSGLVLIALVIQLFNRLFEKSSPAGETPAARDGKLQVKNLIPKGQPVPADHLTAIAVALEIYHKLYYDVLDSKITFIKGEQQTGWKMGGTYGQRSFFRGGK